MKQAIIDRLREPSTWAGLGAVLQTAVAAIVTKDPQAIGATVAGVLAIILKERAR